MNSMKMDFIKQEQDETDEQTDVTTIIIEEDGESISSEEDGAGADCIARSRSWPMRDIWPSDEIVESLKELDTWGAGELVCTDRVAGALALPGAAGVSLLWGCWLAKAPAVALLLKAGADPNVLDAQGRSGLHLSALVGSADCVRLLLDHGAAPSAWDSSRKATPLHCAASAKSVACIQALIKHNADVNAGINDRSPLHYAVQSEAEDCVRVLLENGARADTPQVFTETPLHVAAALGSAPCAALLLKHGADVRARFGPARLTALHLAAEDGHVDCAKELLDRGAPTDTPNKRQQTALHLACIAQATDMVELLVARGASMTSRDQDGRTPLHAALGRSARGSESARALLVSGADPNAPDNYGYTPVHLSALNEFSTCVNMLLDYGGDVTMRTKGGHSALSFIVRRTPEVLPHYIKKFDDAIRVVDHEIGDVDCELKLDFRPLVPLAARTEKPGENLNILGGMVGQARSESSLLLSFVEVGQRDVLKHPLCETFLHLKWKRIRKFFFASLVCHAIFVMLFSVYILGVYLRDCPPQNRSSVVIECQVPLIVKVVGYLLIGLNLLLVMRELFQVLHSPVVYFNQGENWLQWMVIISVFMCAVPGEEDNIKMDLSTWQHHAAAIGIFLAWVELMLIVGRFPMFGLYVQMFATVSVNFSKFLLAYSCLLIAFAFSFGVLFANFKPFFNIFLSFLKTIVMMSGEVEYEDLFYPDDNTLEILYPGTAHALFITFVLLVTIILTNLLVGLAVSDIQALQESAGLDRLVRQAGEVARMESLLFSPLLRWMPLRVLALLHKGALLLSEPYRWALVIRPNDPRENRIPRSLITSIYKLVASKKEQAKAAMRNNKICQGTPIISDRNMTINYRHQSIVNKNNTGLRPRTTSDITNLGPRTFKTSSVNREPEGTSVAKQIAELCEKMEQFQKSIEAKMASFESKIESLSKNSEEQS